MFASYNCFGDTNANEKLNYNLVEESNVKEILTVDEALAFINDLDYEIDEETIIICKSLESYKNKNSDASIEEIIENVEFYNQESEKETLLAKLGFCEVVYAASLYKATYQMWTQLTSAEKGMMAMYPVEAVIAKSCANKAYEWTENRYGDNGVGDESDGYRHAIWNALMTRNINNRGIAEWFATAHEEIPDSQLGEKEIDGYYKCTHRNMDLHNNAVGRSIVSWNETVLNLSDSTLKSRVVKKLTNSMGTGIYWLHK